MIRQVKYLNNLVEQDHRAIKRVTKPMLNFKSFRTARSSLAGIELMHRIPQRSTNAGKQHQVIYLSHLQDYPNKAVKRRECRKLWGLKG